MSRSLLNEEEIQEALRFWKAPVHPPDGDHEKVQDFSSHQVSNWILGRLRAKLEAATDLDQVQPLLMGSAVRGELCPRSDLDFLFLGDEDAISQMLRKLQDRGLRLRAKIPSDPKNWVAGVEVSDEVALVEALPWGEKASAQLQQHRLQQEAWIRSRRRHWLKVICEDQKTRAQRHDGIANHLEPHLKFGPGGLRDIEQGRLVAKLFPECLPEDGHALRILEYYAAFFTSVRQRMHLEGHGDVLVGSLQFDLAQLFGLSHRDFMREIQRGLSRTQFYSSWILARARASAKERQRVDALKWKDRSSMLRSLEKEPQVLLRHAVRRQLDEHFPLKWVRQEHEERGALLWQVLRPESPPGFLEAVFSSRLIDRLCPEILPLVGYVQHDQYHRYTAEIHLQQVCRETLNVLAKPRLLGPLRALVKDLSAEERKIICWTALYHDLMKGREGDHSHRGAELVRKELGRFKVADKIIEEVVWMVESHLLVSKAAFRQNPRAPQTWATLAEQGAVGRRLRRLTVFTALDIRGTNPEAWTNWKAKLLLDLVESVESPSAESYLRLKDELNKRKVPEGLAELDPYLRERWSLSQAAKDLESALKSQQDLAPLLVKDRQGQYWVRFHARHDRPGLFLGFAKKLFDLGLSVRHAAVHTWDEIGAYDAFQVDLRRKSPSMVKKWLAHGSALIEEPLKLPLVKFEKVSLVSADEKEWVLSFKGLDQPGCLLVAAQALTELGLRLKSARVHTWGRQIDDLFHVEPATNPEQVLEALRLKLT